MRAPSTARIANGNSSGSGYSLPVLKTRVRKRGKVRKNTGRPEKVLIRGADGPAGPHPTCRYKSQLGQPAIHPCDCRGVRRCRAAVGRTPLIFLGVALAPRPLGGYNSGPEKREPGGKCIHAVWRISGLYRSASWSIGEVNSAECGGGGRVEEDA